MMSWIETYMHYVEHNGCADSQWVDDVIEAVRQLEDVMPGLEVTLEALSRDEMWTVDGLVMIWWRYKEVIRGEMV